jgi:cytochrome c peroxidase
MANDDLGLNTSYEALIKAGFGSAVLDSDGHVNLDVFSAIWGQAIDAYLATLVPDQSPFDRFMAGDSGAMSPEAVRGMGIFAGEGNCSHCHAGPELTDASASFIAIHGSINEDGGDQGFHNTGVADPSEDRGRFSRPDNTSPEGPGNMPFSESGRDADFGAFKTPGLRNIELTAPYFHNGSAATLDDVIDFYANGGNRPAESDGQHEIDGHRPFIANHIQRLGGFFGGSGARKRADLRAFLVALTDERVRNASAPFDHPSLPSNDTAGVETFDASGTMSATGTSGR